MPHYECYFRWPIKDAMKLSHNVTSSLILPGFKVAYQISTGKSFFLIYLQIAEETATEKFKASRDFF